MVYILPLKRHIRALFSSQAPSNKATNDVIQNGGDLKRICDIFSGCFVILHAEFQICLPRDLKIARWRTFAQTSKKFTIFASKIVNISTDYCMTENDTIEEDMFHPTEAKVRPALGF